MTTQVTTQVSSAAAPHVQIPVLAPEGEGSDYDALGQSLLRLALRRLRRDKLTLLAMTVIVIMISLALLAPFISEQILHVDYTDTQGTVAFLKPGVSGHVLGTDHLGRDYLSRLLYGAQVSLGVGFIAALLAFAIGVTAGLMTGYFGGVVDDLFNWVVATLESIPTLFLLLIIVALFRPSAFALILIFGFLGWTGIARLVRGETLSLREREYVIGARAIGAPAMHIMFRNILPNVLSIVLISLALTVGRLILAESALSFLGLGIQPPSPSWGNMLSNAQTFFTRGVHLVIIPGLMISITVLCMYIVGDGLRDAFDPTLKNR